MRQRQALKVMMDGANVFLTGAPGAGKTYVLNQFIERAEQVGRRVAVTASTGIAAAHIGGTTIHSWSGLGIRDSLTPKDEKRLASTDKLVKRYNATDVLVIDEVSMLHGQRLAMIDTLARRLRKSPAPFGGMQVVLAGDLFQLPPVNRSGELNDFVHLSPVWQALELQICYLTEQHRQGSADELLEMLEAMRAGQLRNRHLELIKSRLNAKPKPDAVVTRLYSHNADVEAVNQRQLDSLPGKSESFNMITNGRAAKIEQLAKNVLAPSILELKKDAEVMFVANDFASGFFNGSLGRVIGFDDGQPLVRLAGRQRVIKVKEHSWNLTEDGKKRAEVTQLPLRLAWAITVHKSQGMSLDAAEIDLSQSFTPGMGYVALSRVRGLNGLFLLGINKMALTLHPAIHEFDVQLRETSNKLATQTEDFEDQPAADIKPAAVDAGLFDSLKSWRLTRARADGVSAFIVAHNRLLDEIARHAPGTPEQLLGIAGFGSAKLEKYGDDILAIVHTHTAAAKT